MAPDSMPDYRRIAVNVYRKPTGRLITTRKLRDFLAGRGFSADYHQQYLAKNPNGYCGIGGCGVPFKIAGLQVGEKA
jgi:peptide methionine sulfoxide reductase MsrA